MSTIELINTALGTVIDPELHKPLPELGMVESVEFEDADSFSKRVETLKEFYFNVDSSITEEKESEEEQGNSSYVTTETIVEEAEVEEVPNAMKKYLNAITRLDRASVKAK